ncbi:chorismate mutase [Emcibacter sp.]|uniref:chorismate mutase n=1 Tax=Emcibacter sp. TaxID=1979954 RepID=UPI003A918FC1
MNSTSLSFDGKVITVGRAENCETMAALREEIDKLDRFLVEVLKFRLSFMEQAAVLKKDRTLVRDDERIEAVVKNVTDHAKTIGLNEGFAERLYRHLIELSIDHEYDAFDIEAGAME